MADKKTADEADRKRALRHLRELIAALDRRVPHIERIGEIAIARDAATLRKRRWIELLSSKRPLETDRVDPLSKPALTAAGDSYGLNWTLPVLPTPLKALSQQLRCSCEMARYALESGSFGPQRGRAVCSRACRSMKRRQTGTEQRCAIGYTPRLHKRP
jgi:hypothetical protein